jgi:hypothetical protein
VVPFEAKQTQPGREGFQQQRHRLAWRLLARAFRRFWFVWFSERALGRRAEVLHRVLDLRVWSAGPAVLALPRRVNRAVRRITVLGGSNVNGQEDERER